MRFVHVTLVFLPYCTTIQHFTAKYTIKVSSPSTSPNECTTHVPSTAFSFCCATHGSTSRRCRTLLRIEHRMSLNGHFDEEVECLLQDPSKRAQLFQRLGCNNLWFTPFLTPGNSIRLIHGSLRWTKLDGCVQFIFFHEIADSIALLWINGMLTMYTCSFVKGLVKVL